MTAVLLFLATITYCLGGYGLYLGGRDASHRSDVKAGWVFLCAIWPITVVFVLLRLLGSNVSFNPGKRS